MKHCWESGRILDPISSQLFLKCKLSLVGVNLSLPIFSSYIIIDLRKSYSPGSSWVEVVIVLVVWEVIMLSWLLSCRLSGENISLPYIGECHMEDSPASLPSFQKCPHMNATLPPLSMTHWTLWLLVYTCPFNSQILHCLNICITIAVICFTFL